MLVGDDAALKGLAATRRMFGASLHTVWPEVALVPNYVAGYQEDYAKAWTAANAFIAYLRTERRFTVEKVTRGTSRFLLSVADIAPEEFARRLRAKNILLRDVNALGQFPMQGQRYYPAQAAARPGHSFHFSRYGIALFGWLRNQILERLIPPEYLPDQCVGRDGCYIDSLGSPSRMRCSREGRRLRFQSGARWTTR